MDKNLVGQTLLVSKGFIIITICDNINYDNICDNIIGVASVNILGNLICNINIKVVARISTRRNKEDNRK